VTASIPRHWRPARVVENRRIARASRWLTLEAADDAPAAYSPGHVLGIGLKNSDGSFDRHAYTVSQGNPEQGRFSHLYRVILGGHLTPRMERLEAGDTVFFHGPAHQPIEDEVDPDATRIVGVATGTGIGPLYGFAAKALARGEERSVTLYSSFRETEDMALVAELRELGRRYDNFGFEFSLTDPPGWWNGLVGRVDECVPERLGSLGETHIHLVGRGEMVHLWRKAWIRAGYPRRRVSTETYFHHDAEPDEGEIEVFGGGATREPTVLKSVSQDFSVFSTFVRRDDGAGTRRRSYSSERPHPDNQRSVLECDRLLSLRTDRRVGLLLKVCRCSVFEPTSGG
jgi:ferredoxin-NADP reductase